MYFMRMYFRKGWRDLLLLWGFEPVGSELLDFKVQPTTYKQNMNVFEGVQGMILFIHCWLCEWKCSHFALIHLCPLSPSQAPQLHIAVSYHYIFCPLFLIGTCLCNITFPVPFNLFLPSTVSLIFQLCIPVPVAHAVLFQKPVFSCLMLLFLSLQYSL